jgi:hypothetical protein
MAIYVKTSNGDCVSYRTGAEPETLELDILADTEEEIKALGVEIVIGGCCGVKAKPGSTAHTAGYGAIYELSPSGVWTKM